MLISLTSIYKTSVIETLKEFAGLQGEKRRFRSCVGANHICPP